MSATDPTELCALAGATYRPSSDNVGNAQTVDPLRMVAEEQHIDEPRTVVVAMHEPVVVADPVTLQPTVGVVKVVQDDAVPEETQETVAIVAVVAEHCDEVDD